MDAAEPPKPVLVGAKALLETHPKGGKSHASEPEGRDQLTALTQHRVQSPSVPGHRGELPRPLLEQSWPTMPLLPLPLVPVLPKF